jgi:hypothetical protein
LLTILAHGSSPHLHDSRNMEGRRNFPFYSE